MWSVLGSRTAKNRAYKRTVAVPEHQSDIGARKLTTTSAGRRSQMRRLIENSECRRASASAPRPTAGRRSRPSRRGRTRHQSDDCSPPLPRSRGRGRRRVRRAPLGRPAAPRPTGTGGGGATSTTRTRCQPNPNDNTNPNHDIRYDRLWL